MAVTANTTGGGTGPGADYSKVPVGSLENALKTPAQPVKDARDAWTSLASQLSSNITGVDVTNGVGAADGPGTLNSAINVLLGTADGLLGRDAWSGPAAADFIAKAQAVRDFGNAIVAAAYGTSGSTFHATLDAISQTLDLVKKPFKQIQDSQHNWATALSNSIVAMYNGVTGGTPQGGFKAGAWYGDQPTANPCFQWSPNSGSVADGLLEYLDVEFRFYWSTKTPFFWPVGMYGRIQPGGGGAPFVSAMWSNDTGETCGTMVDPSADTIKKNFTKGYQYQLGLLLQQMGGIYTGYLKEFPQPPKPPHTATNNGPSSGSPSNGYSGGLPNFGGPGGGNPGLAAPAGLGSTGLPGGGLPGGGLTGPGLPGGSGSTVGAPTQLAGVGGVPGGGLGGVGGGTAGLGGGGLSAPNGLGAGGLGSGSAPGLAGSGVGAAGTGSGMAGVAAAANRGMPMMPPMMPPGMQSGDRDRQRKSWLPEDEDIWSHDSAVVPPVISDEA